MTSFGYTLSSEEQDPRSLVENARRAEDHGFDFVSVSDHYHPWTSEQGHSPFVWAVLGGVAVATQRVGVGVGVTCPIMRVHPAIVAQAAATVSLMLEGRFTLGVGSGEALNEHILGHRWPNPETRLEMLEEAVEVMRKLWTGETVDHRGRYYEVENARLFDPPAAPLDVVVSGFGQKSAELAGRIGDGYWGTSPDRELLETFERAGGRGPRYAQLTICWAEDAARARKTVHQIWPNAAITGQLSQDLPTWTHFEQAAAPLTEEQVTAQMPCGPDIAGEIATLVDTYVEAGYDHLYFHQVGPDQAGFFRFWDRELRAALGAGEGGASE